MRPIFYRRPTINGRGVVRRWSRACRCCGTPWQGPVTLWLSSSIGSKAPRRGSLVGNPSKSRRLTKRHADVIWTPQNRRFANGHPGCLDAVAASSGLRNPQASAPMLRLSSQDGMALPLGEDRCGGGSAGWLLGSSHPWALNTSP